MTTPINPYVAGNPVGDSPAFIGRADVLREVVRVLRRPQDNAIVLYGQRRIGKTSILQHLAAQLPKEGPYRPVYFQLQDKAAWPLGRVLGDLARTIAHALGEPDPELGDDPETAFRQTWLPTTLSSLPTGAMLVLLLDEFDVLADPKAEQAAAAFFPYLRDLMASEPKRLKFVFVIGRNVNDLTNIALSLFKGIPSQRVSLLSHVDTADLVRLSQKNRSLNWPDEAVERIWQLTHGHPFLTQQLCSHVWERAYGEEPDEPPVVTPTHVDAAVSDALEASRNTMEWLWDGLPPAERVVISALAEGGPRAITQDELDRLLRESGVRVLIRELQNAPQLLQDWDLIEPAEGGYCFRVELLRQWLIKNKPLKLVQEQLDYVLPRAENLYQLGKGFYEDGRFDEALVELRRSVGTNPNHIRATLLLTEILLERGEMGEAQQRLEQLFEYHPSVARPRLVQTLLAQALTFTNEDDQLALYNRVLELEPRQLEATSGRKRIWQQRGDHAFSEGDLEAALKAYREADLSDKASAVEQEIRRRQLTSDLQELDRLEQAKQYEATLGLARKLAGEYPELRDWQTDLGRLERKTHLPELYQRALGALQSGDRAAAQTLLAQVIALEPSYEEASRYLHLVVTGVDVAELKARPDVDKKETQWDETVAGRETEARLKYRREALTIAVITSLAILILGSLVINSFYFQPAAATQQSNATVAARNFYTTQTADAIGFAGTVTSVWKAATVAAMPLVQRGTAAACQNIQLYTLEISPRPTLSPPAGTVYVSGNQPANVMVSWTITNTGTCLWETMAIRSPRDSFSLTLAINNVEPGQSRPLVLIYNKLEELSGNKNEEWWLVVNGITLIDQPHLKLNVSRWVYIATPTPVRTPTPIQEQLATPTP